MSDVPSIACALSGLVPGEHEYDHNIGEDDDLLLVGWLEVRVRRKRPNPRYLEIQEAKNAQIEQTFVQAKAQAEAAGQAIPASEVPRIRRVLSVQVDAYWAALEGQTPQYLIEEDTVYIAGAERNADANGLDEARKDVLGNLQIDPGLYSAMADGGYGDEDEDADDAEPVGVSAGEPVPPELVQPPANRAERRRKK